MRACMAASATAEPDTPPIRVDRMIETWASPPAIQATATWENRNSRSVIPLSFIRWPASTKKGTASSGKLCETVAMRCTPIDIGMMSEVRKNMKPEIPMANATGAPSRRRTKKTTPIKSKVRAPDECRCRRCG
jgi:hypothetical protein